MDDSSTKLAENTDEIILYSNPLCAYAQRVRIALALRGIKHRIVNLDPTKREEWFLALNPLGKVPILKLPNGKIIYESLNLIEFLDDHVFDERHVDFQVATPLDFLPKDTEERAQVRMKLVHVDLLGANMFQIALFNAKKARGAKKPEATRRFYDRRLAASRAVVVRELQFLTKSLNFYEFFGGEKPNAIDISIHPYVERILFLSDSLKLRESIPKVVERLEAWYHQVNEFHGFGINKTPVRDLKIWFQNVLAIGRILLLWPLVDMTKQKKAKL